MSWTKSAVVFPGQGSQRATMGKDFYEKLPASRAVFEEASDALGWDVSALCFTENDKLHLTQYAQPCILTTEMAMLNGIKASCDFSPGYYGGHSLGEYTALVAAGVLPFFETVKVVQERGRLMQTVAPEGYGGMAAVIATSIGDEFLKPILNDLAVDVANINSREQVVLSGQAEALDTAKGRIDDALGQDESYRYVALKVSAPFHSRFMRPIQADFKDFFLETMADKINPDKADCVVSNYTGGFHVKDQARIIDALVEQISGPVKWLSNMDALSKVAESFYEIGPNRPLRGFFKTNGVNCQSIISYASASRLFNNQDA